MKVYISQPMRGLSSDEIIKTRSEIQKEIEKMYPDEDEIEFIDSYLKNHGAMSPLKCLSTSIFLLADADCAYFGDGWKNYRGCKIEHECAVQYGITIIKD